MGTTGGFSNIFNARFVHALKNASSAWRRDLRYLNGDLQGHPYDWAENRTFSAIIQQAAKPTHPSLKACKQVLLNLTKQALVFAKQEHIKRATLGTGVIIGVLSSVYSVHASLQDASTIKFVQDPKFYMGIESGYGRMALSDNGLNLATPGLPKTGMFGDQNLSGSFLFGAANLVDLGNGVSLRGELEYQKLGKPNTLQDNSTPLSMFYSRDVETNSGFANLWLDFDLPIENTKVFLGGGLGFSSHSVSSIYSSFFSSSQSTQFAYHVGGGISHSLSPGVDFVVAGRFRDLGESKLALQNNPGGNGSMKHTGFEARIGLRYKLESLMPKR